MATINLHVPEDLLAGLEAKAAASGKTVEELAEEALRASLTETSWEDLLAYGQERDGWLGSPRNNPRMSCMNGVRNSARSAQRDARHQRLYRSAEFQRVWIAHLHLGADRRNPHRHLGRHPQRNNPG